MTISEWTDIEGIQKRPAMYVGSTNTGGLKNIVTGAVKLLLDSSPTFLRFSCQHGQMELACDAQLQLQQDEQGLVLPFERYRPEKPGTGRNYNGTILNALSESFELEGISSGFRWAMKAERGQRIWLEIEEQPLNEVPTMLRWTPLTTFQQGDSISREYWQSWFQRLSFLFPQTRFTLVTEQGERHFSQPGGIRDLFTAVAMPYLIAHEPIYFRTQQDTLQLEVIFASHTRHEDVCLSFINKVRAFEGGTHEQGLLSGLQRLRSHLGSSDDQYDRTGMLCVMFVEYPLVEWHGSQRQKVGNPELIPLIKNAIVDESLKWLNEHPEAASRMRQQEVCVWEGFL